MSIETDNDVKRMADEALARTNRKADEALAEQRKTHKTVVAKIDHANQLYQDFGSEGWEKQAKATDGDTRTPSQRALANIGNLKKADLEVKPASHASSVTSVHQKKELNIHR
jgi:hypothetical protein